MNSVSMLHDHDLLDSFTLPGELEPDRPPEMRGIEREHVRLMVADANTTRHLRFDQIGDELTPGDLLVVNNSATIPAAITLGDDRAVHFSTELGGGLRMVEVRRVVDGQTSPDPSMRPGSMSLPGDHTLELLAPFPVGSASRRLWVGYLSDGKDFGTLLREHGRPIRYDHAVPGLPLSVYQTVFASEPGSSEMPSAGRPFSTELVASLISKGVGIVPVTLHTGVSSLESGEAPYPERFRVPVATADAINAARRRGGRVIGVGTTVLRSLETVTGATGEVHAGSGWTDLVIGPQTLIRSVDGLITGWHEPRSTHLDLLVAVGGRPAIAASYEQGLRLGYLWHEFGDSHLIFRRSTTLTG